MVFNNWSDTIDALMDYFKTNNQTTSFGNWSEIIKELDPFNDNYATYRMSSYLSFLLAGLKDGFRRDTIMENAAQKYADRWGFDKVITA